VEIIASALPPEPDHLDLGEVAIGSKAEVKFKLVNKDDQILRYEFPLEMPLPFGEQMVVKERAGFVQPNSALDIALQFQPTAKLEAGASPVSIVCQTFAVTMNERRASVVSAASEKDNLVDEEPPFTEIENTRKEVPLKLSAMADEHALKEKNADGARGERTDLTEINFKPTMMFASKSFRFVVENSASISALCGFQIQGDTASSFTVTPSKCSIPANGEKEIEVKFSPKEVEHFDCTLVRTVADAPEGTNVVKIPLAGAAKRPWCHIELPPSDYGSRRQSDTPLDPRVRVVEIVSLGTQIKNTKRFYVLNPTSIPIHFEWRYVPPRGDSKGDDDSFRCLTKSGEIRPDKKFEMVFEFAPLVTDTKESFWRFLIMGPVINGEKMKIEETFLLVGMVEEPRVGTDSPAINFGERLIDGETVEKVRLVNKEHIPFSFSFDESSFKIEGQPQVISVSPISGVVGPDTSTDIEVTFKPVQERAFNFNVVCNVKRKKEPVVLNVKGVGYQIHASLSVEESDTSGRRILQTGVVEALDFGVLQVKEFRQMKLYLKNDSRRNFNFRVLLQSGAHRRPTAITSSVKPPYLDIAHNDEGVARHHEETEINIKYAPKDVHRLDGSILHIVVPSGSKEESFMVQLIGGAKRSRVEFSFYEHNFGPCFIANAGTTMAGVPLSSGEDVENDIVKLIATNRDDSDVLLSSTFERLPYLHVHMDDTMIPAGGQITIPIIFSPVAEKEYDEEIVFKVNEYTPMTVKVRGRGCPLRLELTDLQMQNIDFGMTTGGKAVSKRARLVNRSARAVTFKLSDESEHLTQRSVTWNPTGRTTLRPRDTLDVDLRFMPNYKISPFRHPLFAKCDHGVDVRLMQIAGSCHATEVRLSELCVFFSDVVVGSQASRVVKLHNFGDLGSKFRFEMPSRYQGVFTISPAEGFVRPQEEIPLTFTFHPTLDRVREFQRKEASVAKKKIGSGSAIDVTITVKDIRCVLDGHSPLTLEATGNCIDQPREAQRLDFVAEVRKEQVNSIKIKNPTDMDWKLTPTIYMSEPAGTSYWSCPSEVVVAKGKEEEIKIVYRPLTMTELPDEGDGTQPQKAGGQQRCAKHRGNLFIGTPDGKAILYSLEGEALRPKCDQVINERVACKKQHTQSVKVKNWLQARQRFDVQVELIDPAPGTRDAQSIMIRAVDTLDLPAGLEREYKFSVYAYRERPAKIMVNLVSRETGEYKQIEVNLEFFAAESLATINLEAACRQQTRHKISVANPLDTEAKFKSTSTNPYITFSQDPLVVPPNSEKAVDVLFRPVEEGRDTAAITLQSDELGTYPYTVKWIATPAGLDRTLVLKAPLGGSSVEEYKFMHYAQQQVAYSAVVEPVPGHKSPPGAFSIVTGQDLNKPAADSNGTEVSLAVQFRPSILGESKALLVVKGTAGGAQCGEYKALLTGFAQPPQPQGPFTVPNGKGEAKIEFRNPFDTDTNFKFQVDNAAFNASQKEKRMGNGETCQITVQFKSDKPQSGRLIISTDKVSTPWIFFLRGEL
jgi:hydrocephalus-inducing protein